MKSWGAYSCNNFSKLGANEQTYSLVILVLDNYI